MKSVHLTSKAGLCVIGGAFVIGTIVGWYAKTWRLRWLAAKQDFFACKTWKAHEQIEGTDGEIIIQS